MLYFNRVNYKLSLALFDLFLNDFYLIPEGRLGGVDKLLEKISDIGWLIKQNGSPIIFSKLLIFVSKLL